MELVRAYSDPANHRHSLQIEVNRRLYMNEATREPNGNFQALKHDLDRMIAAICAFALEHAPGHKHDRCQHDHDDRGSHHDHDRKN